MQELDLKCKKYHRRYSPYSAYQGQFGKQADNHLNRDFGARRPLEKLVTDITVFKCAQKTKLYLNPILDLHNREIISYAMARRPTLEIALAPLEKTLKLLKKNKIRGTLIHSDQGIHYQHAAWANRLKEEGVLQSMSRRGNCADNAVIENFFGLLKREIYHGEALCSYEQLKKRIETYIHYYNHERIKEKLNGMSPVEYRLHNQYNREKEKLQL